MRKSKDGTDALKLLHDNSLQHDINENAVSSEGKNIFEHIQLPPPIMAPPKNAIHGVDNVIVGTTNLSCNITAAMTNEKKFRGKDRKQGKRLRRCMQCVEFGGDNAFI